MKKKVVLLLVMSMLIMVLVGSISALAEDRVILKVWSPYASPYTRPYFDKMIKIFNDSHDDIKVEHIPVSSGIQEKFRISVIGRSAPDIVLAGMNLLYDPAGKTRPEIEREAPFAYLDEILRPAELEGIRASNYDDGWLRTIALFQGPIALPFEMAAELIFYNKDLFEKAGLDPSVPPKTIGEFHEAAERINTISEDVYGYLFEAKDSDNVMFLERFAAPLNDQVIPHGYKNKDGEYVFTLASDKNAEAIDNFYKKPYQEGWTGEVFGYDYMTARAAFGEGKVGMFRIGSYMMVVYNKQFPDLNYGFMDFPLIDKDGGFVEAGTNTWAWVTNEEVGGHPDAAAEFIKYIASPEAQAIMMLEAGKLMPHKGAYDSEDLPDYISQAKVILDKRLDSQDIYTQKQINRYPDIATMKMGELNITTDEIPQAIAGGSVLRSAGTLFAKYLFDKLSAREYLLELEKVWADALEKEGAKVDKSSLGWNLPQAE